jgi:hypothetical protein
MRADALETVKLPRVQDEEIFDLENAIERSGNGMSGAAGRFSQATRAGRQERDWCIGFYLELGLQMRSQEAAQANQIR